jgi:methionine synthase I (cobalamin-dependent)
MNTLEKRTLLFDGGMGSLMIERGLPVKQVPESWIFSAPGRLLNIHTEYIEAGADVIQTATFGASGIKLASSESGSQIDPVEANRKAARIAREAVERSGRKCFTAGDIGPTGLFFPPVGTLSEEDAMESFGEQALALSEGGVDLFLIETMSDIREAVAALRAAKEAADLPVIVEMTFQRKGEGYFTIMGNTPDEALEKLESEGADAAGANCTLDSSGMKGLAAVMIEKASIPLLFQPNAGQPVLEESRAVYLQKPEEFAGDIEEIVRIGADAVGGCCGTGPEFIRAVSGRLEEAATGD